MKYRDVLLSLIPEDATSGVEIGVHRGRTSELLLDRRLNLTLWMVDPWGDWTSSVHTHEQSDQDAFMQETRDRIHRHGNRAQIIRKESVAAVADVPDGLDFAFIDAEHDYDSVKSDIAAWWTKCGLLICHDYGKPEWGVTDAVHEFAEENNLTVHADEGNIAWLTR